jgi:uncharacterized protein YwlG (UPF0340 family)
MMQVFETGSGKFTPLSDDELGQLTEQQVAAYTELKDAVLVELADADAEIEVATAHVKAAVVALSEVERNTPKFDAEAARVALVKEMIATRRCERGF